MEQSKALQFKVGLLVGGGLLLFLTTVIMLGGDSLFSQTYTLKVKLDQAQGLAGGSVVNILGIKVGNVKSIDIVQQEGLNVIEVSMKINRSFQKKITSGSLAGIRTQGALGDKYVYIVPGDASLTPLEDGGYLQPEGKGGLLDTLAESGDKIEKVFKIVDEIHILMQNINGEGRSQMLMSNLAASSENLKKLSFETQRTTKSLTSILEKIDNGTGSLGALVNDRSVYEGIKQFIGGSQDKYIKNVIRQTIQSKKE
jgi:phospholipid/cholesterol/gamma-HCH transport system substrate-binding protein